MDKYHEPTIARKEIFNGKVIHVVEDIVKVNDDEKTTRELVFHPGAAAILPITKDGKIILVKQFRKPLEKEIWEIPAGKIDVTDNEPIETAMRELEEEIQMTGDFSYLTDFYTSPGFANEKIYLYLATNLKTISHPKAGDFDEHLEIKAFENDELPMLEDAKTIIAIQLAKSKGVL